MAQKITKKIITHFPSHNYSCQDIKNRNCLAFEEIILKLKMDNHLLEPNEDIDFLENPIDYQHANFRGIYSYSAQSVRRGYSHKKEVMHDLEHTEFTQENVQEALKIKNSMNETLMHYMMRNNEWALIQFLLKRYPHDIIYNTSDGSGNTLLHNFNHITFNSNKGSIDEKRKFTQEKFAFLKHLVSQGISLEATNNGQTMALEKILEKGGFEITQFIVKHYEAQKKTLPLLGLKALILHRRTKELSCWLKSSYFDDAQLNELFNIKHSKNKIAGRELNKCIAYLADKEMYDTLYQAKPLCFSSHEMVLASVICLKNYPNDELFNIVMKANQAAYAEKYFSSSITPDFCPEILYETLNSNLVGLIKAGFTVNDAIQEKYLSLLNQVLKLKFNLNERDEAKNSIFSFIIEDLYQDKHKTQYATSLIEVLTHHGALIEHSNKKGESLYEVIAKKDTKGVFSTLLMNRQSYLEKEKLESVLEPSIERKKLKI